MAPTSDTRRQSMFVSLLERSSSMLGFTDRLVGIACAFDPTGRFFEDGTGDLEPLRVYEEGFMRRLIAGMPAPPLQLETTGEHVDASKNLRVRWASCPSPMASLLPDEVKQLHVQIIDAADGTPPRGVTIHFPATADQTYTLRRRLLAEPLLKRGIVSILVTPPFYGRRKPKAQALHYTRSLRDFCLMTHGMIVEGWALVAWARRQPEFGGAMVGLTGVSMGGSIAAVAAAICPGPLAIAPCLATFSGAGVYTEGVLSTQVAWSTFVKEQRCSLEQAKEHVKRMLNRNDINHVIDQLRPVPGVGPRAFTMVNARDDKYVTATEAKHLFSALAPTCAPGDSQIRFIPGGHATSVLAGAPAFVQNVIRSFDVLERRMALQRAEQEAQMHISAATAASATAPEAHPQAAEESGAEPSASGRSGASQQGDGDRDGGGARASETIGEAPLSTPLQIGTTSDDGVDLQACSGAGGSRGRGHGGGPPGIAATEQRQPSPAAAAGVLPPGEARGTAAGDVLEAALASGAVAGPPGTRWVVPSKL